MQRDEKIAVRAAVSGIVQGVGFRYWTVREAANLGLTGYVRNMPDGSVEALLEGSPDAVACMLKLLEDGPPGARVRGVQTEQREYSGAYDSFRARV